jgi:hypothetical protein
VFIIGVLGSDSLSIIMPNPELTSKVVELELVNDIVNKNNGVFESKILFEGLSEEEALLKEREIELDLKNKGYILANIAECGVKAGTTGMKHSKESKHKMSEYWKQYYNENPSPKKGIKINLFQTIYIAIKI